MKKMIETFFNRKIRDVSLSRKKIWYYKGKDTLPSYMSEHRFVDLTRAWIVKQEGYSVVLGMNSEGSWCEILRFGTPVKKCNGKTDLEAVDSCSGWLLDSLNGVDNKDD